MTTEELLRRDILRFKKTGRLPRDWDVIRTAKTFDDYVADHGVAECNMDIPEPRHRASSNHGEAFGRWLAVVLPGLPERLRDAFDYVFVRQIASRDAATILGVSIRTVNKDLVRLRRSIADFCGIQYDGERFGYYVGAKA